MLRAVLRAVRDLSGRDAHASVCDRVSWGLGWLNYLIVKYSQTTVGAHCDAKILNVSGRCDCVAVKYYIRPNRREERSEAERARGETSGEALEAERLARRPLPGPVAGGVTPS